MLEISLSQGKKALVDDDLFEDLNRHKWHAVKTSDPTLFYAVCHVYVNGKRTSLFMHRYVMGLGIGSVDNDGRRLVVDHINHNGLDNRRLNLRVVTDRRNQQNRKLRKSLKGSLVGAMWHKATNKWTSEINYKSADGSRKRVYLGLFDSELEAHEAYLRAVKEVESGFTR